MSDPRDDDPRPELGGMLLLCGIVVMIGLAGLGGWVGGAVGVLVAVTGAVGAVIGAVVLVAAAVAAGDREPGRWR